jgi:hypothetical protein
MTNEQIADGICEAVIKECGMYQGVMDGGYSPGAELRSEIVAALAAKDAAINELVEAVRLCQKFSQPSGPGGWPEYYDAMSQANTAIEKAKGAIG